MNEEKKEIKVVNGDTKELNISTVYEHIKLEEPEEKNENKKKNIVIPKGSSNKK